MTAILERNSRIAPPALCDHCHNGQIPWKTDGFSRRVPCLKCRPKEHADAVRPSCELAEAVGC